MKLVCPKCQFKGAVDPSLTSPEDQVFCARCAAIMEAIPSDGVGQAVLPPAPVEPAFAQWTGQVAPTIAANTTSEAHDVLELPQYIAPDQPRSKPEVVLEDASRTDLPASVPEEVSAAQDVHKQEEHAPTTPALNEIDATPESLPHDWPLIHQDAAPLQRLPKSAPFAYHEYTMLMRVSPLVLLIGALVFLSVLFLCDWLIKSGVQPDNLANVNVSRPAPNNQAVNQSGAIAAATEPVAVQEPPGQQTANTTGNNDQKVENVTPAPAEKTAAVSAPAKQPVSQGRGNFTLQVASYNDPVEAQERVARLQAAGIEAHIVEAEIPRRGTWYRVQVGRFANRTEAARQGEQLRAQGAGAGFIVTQVNAR